MVLFWLLAVGTVIRAAKDGTERALLVGLVLVFANLLLGTGCLD